MGLLTSLSTAMSGLRTTQASIDLVATNVANANSVGYNRRVMSPIQQVAGDRTIGVRSGEVERLLDIVAQRQLRLETAGAAYTGFLAQYTSQVDKMFGTPGDAGALDTSFNDFTKALQALLSDPGNDSVRSSVLDAAGTLATRIGQISENIQALRSQAEARIDLAVDRANELLRGIADLNTRIVGDQTTRDPALLDERDRMIDELSQYMDIHTVQNGNGSVSLMTAGGLTLFNGIAPVTLSFDARAALSPQSLYSTDPKARGVGTIFATSPNGATMDVVANQMIRSGEIAAALEMRDDILVQAQRQLDELAAGLSRAMSDRPVKPENGVIDLTGWQPGNTLTIDYTDGTGTAQRVVLLATNGAALTIDKAEFGGPNTRVIHFDLSVGFVAAVGEVNTKLGIPGVSLAHDGGSELRIDDIASTIKAVSGVVTETLLTGGSAHLPLFVDSGYGGLFTGSFEGSSHLTGLAQRLAVNPELIADKQHLVVFDASTPQGDTVRPQLLLDSLTRNVRSFSPLSGLNGDAPSTTTVADFARRIIEAQGASAEAAARLHSGQSVALAAIESRFSETGSVNIDQEMAHLVQLQTAYGANARVMSAVREMLDLLMRM
ncbi:flagellar hook-associated protein FlgK [Microvirga massiliensis]|uniref:flagellar hook-associated protein FlgK n=1 Tax=Microvirga massiliensis TaxID=1033741 RepID=UPI00062B33A0|nr:flagellar hook-associated protein FlgK [Microvirga massiliensis]